MAGSSVDQLYLLIAAVSEVIADGTITPDNADSSDDKDWLALDWGDSHFEFGIDGGKAFGLLVNILEDRTSDAIMTASLLEQLARLDVVSQGALSQLLNAGNTQLGKSAAKRIIEYRNLAAQASAARDRLDHAADLLDAEIKGVDQVLRRRMWAEVIIGPMSDEDSFEDNLNIYLAEMARHDVHVLPIAYQLVYSPVIQKMLHSALVTYFAPTKITWDQAITRHNDLLDDARASVGFISEGESDES